MIPMPEGEFKDRMQAMLGYGNPEKTILVRCTCPTPEGCVCDQSDDENGDTVACQACIEMEHTESDCMVHILQNWKPGNAVDLRRSASGKLHTEDEFSKFPPNRGRLKLIDGTEVLL